MRYTKFSLQNFRGIKDAVEVDIDANNLICLVGNNESGKTTILQGIAWIGKLCKGERPEVGDLFVVRPKSRGLFTGQITLSAGILFDDEDIIGFQEQAKRRSQKQMIGAILQHVQKNAGRIELSFSYSFHLDSLESEMPKITNGNLQKKEISLLFNFIKDRLPDIVYYDDFRFRIPPRIRFLRNRDNAEAKRDYTLISPENRAWQQILDDMLLGDLSEQNETLKNAKRMYDFWWEDFVACWHIKNGNYIHKTTHFAIIYLCTRLISLDVCRTATRARR